MTRRFLVDSIAFIVQENDTALAPVDCELAQSNEELLVDLLDLLEGGEIRDSDGVLSDPRLAKSCVYHLHGEDEMCWNRKSNSIIDDLSSLTFVGEDK